MTRQDLRGPSPSFSNHETAMNKMAVRNLAFLKARKARREARNRAIKRLLQGILVGGLIGAACSYLYDWQVQCEAVNGPNSRACVD